MDTIGSTLHPSASAAGRPCIAGVIAEYNPFHKGHQFHLEQTRKAGADFIVVVMSTCFTQRGDFAVLPVKERVRMALEGGADAVFALPVPWALRDAEHFALGGVSILSGLGCQMLSFGSETPDVSLLMQAAEMLENPPEAMREILHELLNSGLSFPSALSRAAGALSSPVETVLSSPNNTLAICYLRQLIRLNSAMKPLCIPRHSCYSETQIASGEFASAAAVRAAICRGDWPALEEALPESSLRILRSSAMNGRILPNAALDNAVLCTLRRMTSDEWAQLADQSEGLPVRIRNTLRSASTLDELISHSCTKRYTRARVTRLIMQAFLHLDSESLPSCGPSEALLLGIRQESSDLLHHLGPMHIIGKASDLKASWVPSEETAWDLWSAGCGLPMGSLFTHGIVKV